MKHLVPVNREQLRAAEAWQEAHYATAADLPDVRSVPLIVHNIRLDARVFYVALYARAGDVAVASYSNPEGLGPGESAAVGIVPEGFYVVFAETSRGIAMQRGLLASPISGDRLTVGGEGDVSRG